MKEGRQDGENGAIFIHGFVESTRKKKKRKKSCLLKRVEKKKKEEKKKKKKKEINLSFPNEGYRKFASADV